MYLFKREGGVENNLLLPPFKILIHSNYFWRVKASQVGAKL